MKMEITEPITIYEDNQSAIAMCKNPINHQATKHIAVKLGYIKDELESDKINLCYIPSEHQLADIFTKPLNRQVFCGLREKIGVTCIPE